MLHNTFANKDERVRESNVSIVPPYQSRHTSCIRLDASFNSNLKRAFDRLRFALEESTLMFGEASFIV